MRSRQRSPEAPVPDSGGERCDDPGDVSDAPETPVSVTEAADVAQADDEAAQAQARAEAARARAKRLRQAAETAEASDSVGSDPRAADRRSTRSSRPTRNLRRPSRKAVAIGAAIVLAGASLGASGYVVWQHHAIVHKRQLAQDFAAAARNGVTALMSIDAHHAKEDIQRIIDASTGDLKTQLEATSSLMVKQAADSNVVSKATVQAVAVESVTDDSAVVLVSAKSDVTDPDNTKRPPALWRISVNIERDGSALKMSRVEFLQ